MKSIEIDDRTGLVRQQSSKGYQPKWRQDGFWYKADGLGYESLAEAVCSSLLKQSTMAEQVIAYDPVRITCRGQNYRGCRSRDFRESGQELITLERLARSILPQGLARQLARIYGAKDRIRYTVELVGTLTGIENYGTYLADLLLADALFLNEDRHTNNLAFLYDPQNRLFSPAPSFDLGAALFSDCTRDYRFPLDYESCLGKVHAKPFSRDFDEQLNAAEELYDTTLRFCFRPEQIAEKAFGGFDEEALAAYSPEEKARVEETLRLQARRYAAYFTA